MEPFENYRREVVEGALASELTACVIDTARLGGVEHAAALVGMAPAAFAALSNLHDGLTQAHRPKGPRLVHAPDAELLEQLLRTGWEHQAVMVLQHSGTPSAVESHLRSLIKLPQPDGSKLLFRWHDAEVLSALAPLLEGNQRKALLGPVRRWMALDVCRRLAVVEHPGEGRVPGSTRAFALTQMQLKALSDQLLVHTVSKQVDEVDASLLAGVDGCERTCRLRQLLDRGRGHGLEAEEDLSLFAVLALQLPPDFDEVGPVAQALETNRHSSMGFGEAIDAVPVETWRAWDEVLDQREDWSHGP